MPHRSGPHPLQVASPADAVSASSLCCLDPPPPPHPVCFWCSSHACLLLRPAGAVTYKTDNFLSKNRDFVVAEHQALLGASSAPFVRGLFPPDEDGGAGKAQSSYRFSSVGSRFKRQLGDLMDALHRMEPHYIRCIKPNSFNRPMDFENMNVLHQVGVGARGV